MASHMIKTWTKENNWFGEVTIATSQTETSAPYKLEAPSQTMLLELIRTVLRLKERNS